MKKLTNIYTIDALIEANTRIRYLEMVLREARENIENLQYSSPIFQHEKLPVLMSIDIALYGDEVADHD